MCEPLGLHRRLSTSTGNVVICVASPPATGIVQISREPERPVTKAIVRLSGDQVGEVSAWNFAVVSCRCCDPSLEISHKFVVALFASGSHVRTVKTIHWPS